MLNLSTQISPTDTNNIKVSTGLNICINNHIKAATVRGAHMSNTNKNVSYKVGETHNNLLFNRCDGVCVVDIGEVITSDSETNNDEIKITHMISFDSDEMLNVNILVHADNGKYYCVFASETYGVTSIVPIDDNDTNLRKNIAVY